MKKDCNVLVIEDDQDTREALVELLLNEGYGAEGASDGKQALELLDRREFKADVIVLDLYMPTMTGREFRDELGKRPEYAGIPVIFCTGSSQLTSTPDAFDTLRKPMDVDELLAVVRRGCAATPRHSQPMTG